MINEDKQNNLKKHLSKHLFKYIIGLMVLLFFFFPIITNTLMFFNLFDFRVAKDNDWIGFFSSYFSAIIGGLISGGLTLLGVRYTLREMINQRKDSVRPELFLIDLPYTLKYNPKIGHGEFSNPNSPFNKNKIYMSLNNIGVGHARIIHYEWIFEEFSSKVNFILHNQNEHKYIANYNEEENYILFSESSYTYLDKDFLGHGDRFLVPLQ